MLGNIGDLTLDMLFRRAVVRRPNDIALIDPPNRNVATDGPPCRLTYAQADRAISAMAWRLRCLELPGEAIVAFQVANTVESVLTLLAILRAGLVAMPMPLLWRRGEAVEALSRVGANALVVSGRIGNVDHFNLAVQLANDVFTVRSVCGFGSNPPDGVVALDDILAADTIALPPSNEPEAPLPPDSDAPVAVITWDVTPDGLVSVARSQAELLAGGLAILLEGRLTDDAVILSTIVASSFAGLATAIVPWLFVGGTLALHHPFDDQTFVAQVTETKCGSVIIPGPLAAQFAVAGLFSKSEHLKNIIAIWRAPERLVNAAIWDGESTAMIDVQVFGEIGLIATRREPNGNPTAVPIGNIAAPRGSQAPLAVSETQVTANGTLAIRGPMVPRSAFPAGVEWQAIPHFRVATDGFVDTGYHCQSTPDDRLITITTPPPGIVSVGGYRLVLRALEDTVAGYDGAATLVALPDALTGHRLAGSSPRREQLQQALNDRGVNPLLTGAFEPGIL